MAFKKNKLQITSLLIFLSLCLMPLLSAVNITNTDLYSTGLNLTINITTSKFTDSITIENTFIQFINLRDSETQSEKLTFNITESNKQYFGTDLPYISNSNNNTKVITNNLINNLSSINILSVTNCNVRRIYYTSASGNFNTNYNNDGSGGGTAYTSCSNNSLILTSTFENGNNTYTFDYTTSINTSCDLFSEALGKFGTWIALIIICLIIAVVYGLVTNQKANELGGAELIKRYIFYGIIVLVMASIILVFGLLLIEGVC